VNSIDAGVGPTAAEENSTCWCAPALPRTRTSRLCLARCALCHERHWADAIRDTLTRSPRRRVRAART